MGRTSPSQPIHLVVTAVALAVLITGCGSATTASTTHGSPSPDRTATPRMHKSSATRVTRQTATVGLVVTRTKVANRYRIVLAPARTRTDGSVVAIPHRPTVTYLIPTSWVPHGYMLNGLIEVKTVGHRVSGLSILG